MSADVVQSGPLVPTRNLNASTGGVGPNLTNIHTIYHEMDPGAAPDRLRCQYIDYNYDLAMATLCGFYLLFGIIYSIFGYRCFKAIMFLTGFLFGSVVVYIICLQEKLLPSYGNAGVAVSAGILFGLITMLVQYVGLFMTGFHTGLLLSIVGVVIAVQTHYITSVWIVVGVLLAGGLFFAVCNLYWQKGLTIIGTSIYGGAIVSVALDYFVEQFGVWLWVWSRISQRKVQQPCWFGWLLLGVWPFMVMVGIILQFAVTGTGIHHDDMPGVKNAPIPRMRTREEREKIRQNKYRYLYQVRTAHGDVISKSYVQALHRRGGTPTQGDMNTLQSDSTHLSHLPGEQAAQLAALTESEDDLVDSRETSADVIASSLTSVSGNFHCR